MATKGVSRTGRGSSSSIGGLSGGKKKDDETKKVEAAAFTAALGTATEKQKLDADLDELLNKLKEQAQRLVRAPTYPELLEYRTLVHNFLDRVVKGVYKVAELESLRFHENGKVFLIAQKVDEKLAQLADEVLKEQKDAMNILNRTDEIRGLLFDLLG